MSNKIITVKETLTDCLFRCPFIFKNKWDVYHQWFAVNGNGYKWVDGCLVDGENNKTISSIKDAIDYRLSQTTEHIINYGIKSEVGRLKEDLMLIIDIENRLIDFTPTEKRYPLCEYAKILNIPSDIRQDWEEAAIEFYEYLLANRDSCSENDNEFIDMIKL